MTMMAGGDTNEPRILVVDDDAQVQLSLGKCLQRLGYQVEHASNGVEALDRASRNPPDVVLTDLRMPQMDGHTLLRRLRQARLDAAVVVMSAYGSMEDVIDALRGGAVDFLKKPWSTSELVNAVERACEVNLEKKLAHRALAAETQDLPRIVSPAPAPAPKAPKSPLDGILEQLRSGEIRLPAVPAVISELRVMLARPSTRAAEVAALIERDQHLTGLVLKLAASAVYGRFGAGKAQDLTQAVALVGFRQIGSFVETIFAHSFYSIQEPNLRALQQHVWRASVTRAVAMRALGDLSQENPPADSELAYVAGLFCDVGAAFLLWAVSEKATALGLTVTAEQVLPMLKADHAELGGMILKTWALDAHVVRLAETHHARTPPVPSDRYWLLSTLATDIVDALAPGDDVTHGHPVDRSLIDRSAAELGIGPVVLRKVQNSLRAEVREIFERLG